MSLRHWIARKIAPELCDNFSRDVLEIEASFYKQQYEQLQKKLDEKPPASPVDLTRQNLGLIRLDEKYVVDLEKYDDDSYLQKSKQLLESDMFKDEIKRIIFEQMHKIAMDSPSWESNLLARGTINGVCLLQERLQLYNGTYEQRKQQAKEESERTHI